MMMCLLGGAPKDGGEQLKTCFKCGVPKPLVEFYRHSEMADGHLGKCKECTKGDVVQNYVAKRPQYLTYEKSPTRVLSRRKRSLPSTKRYRQRYPEKYAAHTAVAYAIRSGRLFKGPCEVCGEVKVEAHHEDYSKPLEVRWLCHAHHRAAEGRLVKR